MPLTYDATNVKDFDTLTDDEKVTYEALIWASMAVGMNEITAANVREFFTRVSFWEKVNGAYRYKDGAFCFLTPEDVSRFVGLRTNASRYTVAQFRKNVWDAHERWNVPREV